MRQRTFQQLISDGVLEIGDGYRAKLEELGGTGPIFLRAGHVSDTHITFEGAERFRSELESALRSKMSRPGDTIITTKGNSTGRTSWVSPEMPRFVYSPHLSYWRSLDPDLLEPGFLRYWAKGAEFQSQLAGMKESTDMAPYLSLSDQRRLKISLPAPREQQSIARVLGALDDKVELNRQMSRTLEAMAQALFKSWFVDFDPVVAKAADRQPFEMDAATAALFPSRFADSELGPIPEGWEVSSVYKVADVHYGAPFASSQFNSERRGLPLLRIRDLADHEPQIWTDEVHPKGRTVRPGEIVVGMDGEFRAYVWRGPESWLNQRVCLFAPRSPAGVTFVLHSIRGPLEEVERSEVGTTVIHLGKADMDRFRVVSPDAPVLGRFSQRADPLLERVVESGIETRALVAVRDALLPKLLSGEIRVKDAEREAERSV